jgi:hypothetical protein
MKWWIPLTTSVSLAAWTALLLYIQKIYLQNKLNSQATVNWIELQIEGLIERIIPDIALPFLPESLLSKLKHQGSKEIKSLIPKVQQAATKKAKKAFIVAILSSFLFGAFIGLVIIFFN